VFSGVITFALSLLMKRLEFKHRKRSTAAAIFVEIGHARDGAKSLHVNWKDFGERVEDPNYKPLLVVSSDITLLSRTKLEELDFPPPVISAVVKFDNAVRELYECLRAMNSDRFGEINAAGRLQLVEMAAGMSRQVQDRADEALKVMSTKLPKRWFDMAVGASRLDSAKSTSVNTGA
jgi:hypothetical protein